jgi:NAD(P)H-nitrite reductase large subunit
MAVWFSTPQKNRQRRLEPQGFRRFFLLFFTVMGLGQVSFMNSNVATLNKPQTLVVIGNGMVGHHCVEQLIERGALDRYRLHVFSEEPIRAYDRVHLSEYFSGRDAESLALSDAALYETQGVTLHLGVPVLEIDRARRQVITAQGCVAYDKLVLATGSYPFVPPIEGAEGDSRLVYRTLEDLDAIRAAAANARRGVVVGGGLLGLEAANALKSLGLEAHVVEFAPRLMPVQLDDLGGLALKAQIERLGVGVHLSRATQSISAGEQYRYRMNFANDEFLETDLIVFSAGIRAQDALARQCALEIGPRGGVVIDDTCLSCDPNIYAIGECASWNGSLFGLVAPGYQMARSVAARLCDDAAEPFQGADMSTKLKLLGVDVGSIGDAHANTPGARSYQFIDETTASYRRLVVDASGKHVLGAVLIGDNSYYDTLLQYMQNAIALPAEPAALILPSSEGAPTLGPGALPETATVCSCHNVTKGAICSAIDGGCTDLGLLKSQTKACTGCGGCAGLLKQVFEHELIAIGVVAKKYDLYTKITGGQRIDLFGAQLHQLPDIWGELIEAGFETGHAYGKSTRTVKSCVGSTWCRYGVQDSVQMALTIEDRYKGLRSPHKLKFAVSGCTRECAEAQSKDVGVIATEKGWNLYIAGNGGMRPRHAELFATDLDDATLIRYIDRFLMFYIRTADKLQRTSVWRESLEGGLDYLKDVIIHDSLGLGAELESQMQLVVNRYECEWANALKDPEKLKRFRTFVNDKRPDPDIHFVQERGQRRPIMAAELNLIPVTEESV